MGDETYNGWTNYETWRINLEILSDFSSGQDDRRFCEMDRGDQATELEEYVDEILTGFDSSAQSIALDYARSFVREVNFYEIAKHVDAEIDEMYPADEQVDA